MTSGTRIGLAVVAAFITAVPVTLVAGGLLWAYLEGTLHYGCFQGRGGEEGYGWICGDGMSKVLPHIFIAGAILTALFSCYLVVFSFTSDSGPIAGLYPITATVSTIPALLWVLTLVRTTLVNRDQPSNTEADLIGGIDGIPLVFVAVAIIVQLATCIARSRRARRILLSFVGVLLILSVAVAPVSIAVVAPWMFSLTAIALVTFARIRSSMFIAGPSQDEKLSL